VFNETLSQFVASGRGGKLKKPTVIIVVFNRKLSLVVASGEKLN
jgi:hypothetical protein